MNKDEILAKSWEENKTADERIRTLQLKAVIISRTVGLALCMIIAFLEAAFGDSQILFYSCYSIYWGMIAVEAAVLGITTKRKAGWLAVPCFLVFLLFSYNLVKTLLRG